MERKKRFTGWYLKQEKGADAVAFIPAFHISGDGRRLAFIQVITKTDAWQFVFEEPDAAFSWKEDWIRIGQNLFSEHGIRVDLRQEINGRIVRIYGKLKFPDRKKPSCNCMGPLRFLPLLQCRHGVVSMAHKVRGTLSVDGQRMDFSGGRGYIEKDSGSSFPDWYFWCHCGWRKKTANALMVSVADVSVAGLHFKGCTAFVYANGKEYRLATFLGARIQRVGKSGVLLKQGKMTLSVRVLKRPDQGSCLAAPQEGGMDRRIRENLVSRLQCRLYRGRLLLVSFTGNGSVEFVNSVEKT